MNDKIEQESNLYDKIIVKNYNNLSLAEQFEKGAVVKVDDENTKLKQQLAIAIEALKQYADDNEWMDDLGYGYCNKFPEGSDIAQQALQKIKELNK